MQMSKSKKYVLWVVLLSQFIVSGWIIARLLYKVPVSSPNDSNVMGSRSEQEPASAETANAAMQESDSVASIEGRLELAPSLKSLIQDTDVVFIIARQSGVESGPPVAVKKEPVRNFPMTFRLDASNVMMAGVQFVGHLDISVRIDKDGDAMTKNKGDLVGFQLKVPVGSKDAVIKIVEVLP